MNHLRGDLCLGQWWLMPLGSKADRGSINIWELGSLCKAMECSRREGKAELNPSLFVIQGRQFVGLPQTSLGSGRAFWKGTQKINGLINLERKEGMFLFEYEMDWNFHSEGAILGIPITVVWQNRCSSSAWVLNLAGQRAFFSWALFHVERMSQLF